ncbi:glucose-6-phosphatase catalytic subunit 1 [Epargyreus clarus]|uniref:glucose-6-phosphatase catalytic subunit 1 n=1 Tax=Epargyreus clarus TaxID=520877 RepID=UPI003C2CE14B
MELLYAFGIFCIQVIQDKFSDMEWHLDKLNQLYNPHMVLEYGFPVIAGIDSVFGAQMLLAVAFGGWINTMLKWILVEDRPYWWVRETSYYEDSVRPTIRQGPFTCETGPGSPSGHCAVAATLFMLCNMWCSHMINDLGVPRLREIYNWLPLKTMYFSVMTGVGLARMYAGAHFPHQCLLGGLVGSFISPTVCLFVTDPFLFRSWQPAEVKRAVLKHIGGAVAAGVASLALGILYIMMGIDLHWATRLAFRWCTSADYIKVKSTPVFAIVQTTASLLGWALTVTPSITKYRFTSPRNHLLALLGTVFLIYFFHHIQEHIPTRRVPFYASHFILNLIKPFVYLRVLPAFATLGCSRPRPTAPSPPASQPAPPGGIKED